MKFKDESTELLMMEKIIRANVVDRLPALKMELRKMRFSFGICQLGLLASATAAVLILFLIFSHPEPNQVNSHRFVIYRPDVTKAEITGAFADWQRIQIKRIGSSGYREAILNLPNGEHRYTYILDGGKRFADPTVPVRERGDFGGRNSII